MILHTNRGEVALLLDTFCQVWGAGGQATLTTTTKDGQVIAKLELQLGHPADARPGAPGVQQRLSAGTSSAPPPGHPGAARRPRHRGPAAKAKNCARAALHQATKASAAQAEAASALPAEGASLSTPPTEPDGAPLSSTAALAEADSASPARPSSPTEPAGGVPPPSSHPSPPQPEVTNLGEAVPASPTAPSTQPTEPAGPLPAPALEKLGFGIWDKLDYITFCDIRTGSQVFKCKKRGEGDYPPPECCMHYSDLLTLKLHYWSHHDGPPPHP